MPEKDSSDKIDYVILGAGITGLSTALALKGCNYGLFEKDRIAGGMCRTEDYNGFLFDYAEHLMRLDDNEVKRVVSGLLKDNLESHLLNSAIYLKGCYMNYPFQLNLFGLPPQIVQECLIGYIEAYYQKMKPPRNFEEWIYSSFGKGIAEYFMLPYNDKIWTVHPREMTTDWFFNRNVIPTGDLKEAIRGALERRKNQNIVRWYPKRGGIKSLPESYITHIKNLHLNKTAVRVVLSEKKIAFEDGSSVKYDILINTIPLPELIRIMDSVPDDVRNASSRLRFNSVLCLNFGIDRSHISDRHWIYFPEKEYIFSRVYFPMNFSPDMVPEGKSSVSAIITYSENRPLMEKDVKNRVIIDLIKVGILKRTDKILFRETMDIKYGFNIYDHEREGNVRKILAFLEKNGIYSIGRYGRWEYSGIEHSILESKDLVDRILSKEQYEKS